MANSGYKICNDSKTKLTNKLYCFLYFIVYLWVYLFYYLSFWIYTKYLVCSFFTLYKQTDFIWRFSDRQRRTHEGEDNEVEHIEVATQEDGAEFSRTSQAATERTGAFPDMFRNEEPLQLLHGLCFQESPRKESRAFKGRKGRNQGLSRLFNLHN